MIDESQRVLQLLLLYSAYTETNIVRFRRERVDGQHLPELVLQLIHQGAATSISVKRIVQQTLIPERVKRHRLD